MHSPTTARKDSRGDLFKICVYFVDATSVQFTVEHGREATASDLLVLMAEHLGIAEEVVSDVCALWLISPLLEVQLKPHHVAADVHAMWPHFLRKYTKATDDEATLDEPLLVLKRNVYLTIDIERMYEKDYEKIVDLLYMEAKDEYFSGRYLVNVDDALELAAIQLAIDIDPYDNANPISDHDLLNIVHERLHEFVPDRHLAQVRSFYLFGIYLMECKQGLESKLIENYKDVSVQRTNKNELRKTYLDILRRSPFYGAAFFNGETDRRSTSFQLLELSRRFFTGNHPSAKMNIRIGIQHDFITVVDPVKSELLLAQPLNECHCFAVDDDTGVSDFLVHFVAPTANEAVPAPSSIVSDAASDSPPTKILQISTKQSAMMVALLARLDDIAASDIGSASDLMHANATIGTEATTSGLGSTTENHVSYVTSVSCLSHSCDSSLDNMQDSEPESTKLISLPSSYRSHSPPQSCAVSRTTVRSDQIALNNKLSKLCLATLDSRGCCIEAHGSLRKILIPVH